MDAAKIAISSDHTNMVKFESEGDEGFRKVYAELSIMLKKAPQKVEGNWKATETAGNSGW